MRGGQGATPSANGIAPVASRPAEPHRGMGPRRWLPAILVIAALVVAELGLVLSGTPAASAVSLTPNWLQLSPATSPPARTAAAMAYDPATGDTVLFGGVQVTSGPEVLLGDTWTWDGSTWSQVFPSASPPALYSASFAYDDATNDLVLFGGISANGDLSETWIWNGTTWTQEASNALQPPPVPPTRHSASMVFDQAASQMVLFGGVDGRTVLDDTWTWNGTTWTQQHPSAKPSSRYAATMSYDPAKANAVLFGGFSSGETAMSDTWTWNGSTWAAQNPTAVPPARFGASMAYDPVQSEVVLFGGYDNGATDLSDMWTWNGTNWMPRSPSTSPPARRYASIDYDVATGDLLLFGGDPGDNGTPSSLGDTWIWGSGGTFSESAASPSLVLGASDTATATVMGEPGAAPPTGTVAFYACGPTAMPIACGSQADSLGSAVTLSPGPGETATATSSPFTPTAAGTWCFGAIYSGDANYSEGFDNTTDACFSVVAPVATTPTAAAITLGSTDSDNATVFGTAAGGVPTGTMSFYECGPTTVPTPCTSTTNEVGGPLSVTPGADDTATASSPTFSPDAVGYWCFAGDYSGDGNYSPASDSTTDECVSVTPVFATDPTLSSIGLGASDTDVATATSNPGSDIPTGTVTFYECGPTATPTPCTSQASPLGTPVTLTPGSGDAAQAVSPSFTPDAVGVWCFGADYSGDGTYPASADTTTDECFDVAQVAPAFTSAASASATAKQAFTFTIATTGSPAAAITSSGTKKKWVGFTDNHNGTATLSSTAPKRGKHVFTFTATNSAGSVTQTFLLTVGKAAR
jgi:hypothetical protein